MRLIIRSLAGLLFMATFLAVVPAAQAQNACRLQRDAKCAGANLEGRDMRGVNLRGADLKGARLRGANLAGADLGGADLSESDLRFANLGGAALFATKMVNADLTGAGLRFDDLRSDTDISGAVMPDGKRCQVPSIGECKNPSPIVSGRQPQR
jgi:uncharacterized protein YjbI with pentapeptide repeats